MCPSVTEFRGARVCPVTKFRCLSNTQFCGVSCTCSVTNFRCAWCAPSRNSGVRPSTKILCDLRINSTTHSNNNDNLSTGLRTFHKTFHKMRLQPQVKASVDTPHRARPRAINCAHTLCGLPICFWMQFYGRKISSSVYMSFNAPATRERTPRRACAQLIAHRHRPVTSSASTEAFLQLAWGGCRGTAPASRQLVGSLAAAHPASACLSMPLPLASVLHAERVRN